MRALLWIALTLIPLQAAVAVPETAPFDALEGCLQEMTGWQRALETRVPSSLLELDRKLVHLLSGVSFYVENGALLKKASPEGGLIVENAVLGCREYVTVIHRQIMWFVALGMSLALLVSAIGLRTLLGPSGPKPHSAPQDRPAPPDIKLGV